MGLRRARDRHPPGSVSRRSVAQSPLENQRVLQLEAGSLFECGTDEPYDPPRVDAVRIQVRVVDGDVPTTRAGAQRCGGDGRELIPAEAAGLRVVDGGKRRG